MIYKLPVVIITSTLLGCAGAHYVSKPLSIEKIKISKVCVVDNTNLPGRIQGEINNQIVELGYQSYPIPSPIIAKEIGCEIYLTYGGRYEWDMVDFLTEFRISVYNLSHDQIAYAEGKIPNNLNLDKYSSGKKLSKGLIVNIFTGKAISFNPPQDEKLELEFK